VRAEVTGKLAQRGVEVVVPRRDVAAGTPLSSGGTTACRADQQR
jgi:pilus assembly protein CpaB